MVKVGGLNIKDATNRVLKEVFSQEIAEITSKTGKGEGNKYAFLKLRCADIIIGRSLLFMTSKPQIIVKSLITTQQIFNCSDAVLRQPICQGKTKRDVEAEAERFFNGAKDRDGGRERRRGKTVPLAQGSRGTAA